MSDFVKDTNVPTNGCISRQAAIEIVDRYNKSHMILKGKPMLGAASIVIELEALPSAQPEIVRCKDCKLFGDPKCLMCLDVYDWAEPDGYCHMAERREK